MSLFCSSMEGWLTSNDDFIYRPIYLFYQTDLGICKVWFKRFHLILPVEIIIQSIALILTEKKIIRLQHSFSPQ